MSSQRGTPPGRCPGVTQPYAHEQQQRRRRPAQWARRPAGVRPGGGGGSVVGETKACPAAGQAVRGQRWRWPGGHDADSPSLAVITNSARSSSGTHRMSGSAESQGAHLSPSMDYPANFKITCILKGWREAGRPCASIPQPTSPLLSSARGGAPSSAQRTGPGPARSPRTRYQGPQLLARLVPPLERQAEVIVPQRAAHVDVGAADVVGRAVDAHRLRGSSGGWRS